MTFTNFGHFGEISQEVTRPLTEILNMIGGRGDLCLKYLKFGIAEEMLKEHAIVYFVEIFCRK